MRISKIFEYGHHNPDMMVSRTLGMDLQIGSGPSHPIDMPNLVSAELEQGFEREMVKLIRSNPKHDFFDMRPLKLNDFEIGRELVRYISLSPKFRDYDFAVTNSRIASYLMDSPDFAPFQMDKSQHLTSSGTIYQIGTISGRISVLVDPYQRYSDDQMFFGKRGSFTWNLSEVKTSQDSYVFKARVGYEIRVLSDDFTVLFPITDLSDPKLVSEYRSKVLVENREKKIDSLLG